MSDKNNEPQTEIEKILFKYGCNMTNRRPNRDEFSVLMRYHNGLMAEPLSDDELEDLTESAFMFRAQDDVDIDRPVIVAEKRQLLPLLGEVYDSLRQDDTLFRHGGGLAAVRDGRIVHYTIDSVDTLLSRWANYIDAQQNSMFPPKRAASAVLFVPDGSPEDAARPRGHSSNPPSRRNNF